MKTPREDAFIPEKPTDCKACIALNEVGADHPYMSIFYSVVLGTIYFFGIPVTGLEEPEEEDADQRLIYEGVLTDPDEAIPLAAGALTPAGSLSLDADPEVYLRDESESLDYIAIIRALYQMREELLK